MSDSRPYTNEELATAHQAAKDFMDSFDGEEAPITARDLAFFDYGFKRGRRTPTPATSAMLEWFRAEAPLTRAEYDRRLAAFLAEAEGQGVPG